MDAIANGPRKKFLYGSLDLVLKLAWNEAAGVAENTLILCRGIMESAFFCQEKSCFKNTFLLFKVTTLFTLGTWVERCTVSDEDW